MHRWEDDVVYEVQRAMGTGIARYELLEDGVRVISRCDGSMDFCPYEYVTKVQLCKLHHGIGLMTIHREGREALQIASHHAARVGVLEPRVDEYRDFVEEFHSQLAMSNPDVALYSGNSLLYYLGWVFALIALALGVLWLCTPLGSDVRVVVLLGVFLVSALVTLHAGRTKRYGVYDLPEEHLP